MWHLFSRAVRPFIALAAAGALVTSAGHALAQAQVTFTAKDLAVTAADLGPEWSQLGQPSSTNNIYNVNYANNSGGAVHVYTAIATTTDGAESFIDQMQRVLDAYGLTIVSVQSQGFGDGRAFEARLSDSHSAMIGYLFRVHTMVAMVFYEGNASDAEAVARSLARAQEVKLWAIVTPPPAAATPTPQPTPPPTPAPTASFGPPTPAPNPTASEAPAAAASSYCGPGEQPAFHGGFAALSAQLGTTMGTPTSCEYADPNGSGDTLQNTNEGLAIYRRASNTPTFTNGSEHWAITSAGLVSWTGDS